MALGRMRHLSLSVKVCLLDLIGFVLSFAFFGGAHGPAGPDFWLGVINWPIDYLYRHIPWSIESDLLAVGATFVVVGLNGYLYGLVAQAVSSVARGGTKTAV